MVPDLRSFSAMFHSETHPDEGRLIRPIRMLPFALAAAMAAYGLAVFAGAGPVYGPIAGAIAGGWALGRLTRTPGRS